MKKLRNSPLNLVLKKVRLYLNKAGFQPILYLLEKGIVKFNYENELKKNLILTIVSAPKILGGANLFYKDNNLFSFIAVEGLKGNFN